MEFKDVESPSATPLGSPNRSPDRTPSGSDREQLDEDHLDYGHFNVDNAFVGQTPELHPCTSELLDEPVCIHDDKEEGEEGGAMDCGTASTGRKPSRSGKSVDFASPALTLDPIPMKPGGLQSLERPPTAKEWTEDRKDLSDGASTAANAR